MQPDSTKEDISSPLKISKKQSILFNSPTLQLRQQPHHSLTKNQNSKNETIKNHSYNSESIIKTKNINNQSIKSSLPSIIKNSQSIKKMMQKLDRISHSVDIPSLHKNPLNLIQYEMQSEKSRHDPQMILAKLRKLQNRAQIHRANHEIQLLMHQKSLSKSKLQQNHSQHKNKQPKLSYIKIYQSYLKQKQLSNSKPKYQDDEEQQNLKNYYLEDLSSTQNGVKYFNALQKHPKLIQFTLQKKHYQQGLTELQSKIKNKLLLSQKLKKSTNSEEFTEQKVQQQEKQSKRYFENPQKVIERQMTKFYMKKNTGKLSNEAEGNERSQSLIKRQKQISISIDESKISKQDRKKLQSKYNDLANELAKSDRKKSLIVFQGRQ